MPDHQGSLPAYSINQHFQEVVSGSPWGRATSRPTPSRTTCSNADLANMPYLVGTPTHLQSPHEEMPRYFNHTQFSPVTQYGSYRSSRRARAAPRVSHSTRCAQ